MKPLHVRVAEALGWTRAHYRLEGREHDCGDIMIVDQDRLRWKGRDPGTMLVTGWCVLIPRYDTDWSATGPLIEKYRIGLIRSFEKASSRLRWHSCTDTGESCSYGSCGPFGLGETPLIAICHLILALAEAGKLDVP